MSSVSSVSGFSEDALRFLVDLGSSDKAWFDEHRPACQSEIVAPAKAFVEARGEALTSGSYPLIQAQPRVNGSMAPINNDLRWRTAVDEHGEPLAAAISLLQAEHDADLAADVDVHRWLVEYLG